MWDEVVLLLSSDSSVPGMAGSGVGGRDGSRRRLSAAGAGLTLTFPADAGTPPLAGIDHILTVNSSAADVDTVAIPGSDHRGLYGTIRLPAS